MTKMVSVDLDWAYYIDPSFEMPRARSKVPLDSIVIEKEKETIDTGQTIIVTTYSIAEPSGLRKLSGKREASSILANRILEYMRETGQFPAYTEIKKEYKNGNVDLLYAPTDYDKFTIRMTPKMIDGSVIDFLDTLDETGRVAFHPSDVWKIEPAKSGRSSCKTCREKINKDSLRVGEPSYFQDHLTYKWHHLDCIADEIWGIPEDMLEGYSDLTKPQKQLAKSKLKI